MTATKSVMKPRTFNKIRSIVYETSGISLSDRKEALVSARVSRRVRTLGLGGYEEYLQFLASNEGEIVGLLDAVSTNVTSFFREEHHFEMIADYVTEWHAAGQRRFRFWSAACSTGEEPYSLAMVLGEALPYPDVDVRILGTDINTQVLDRCREAVYDVERLKPVPTDLRRQWFDPVTGSDEQLWRAKARLRDRLVFRRLNLSRPPFPMTGPMDAIFCRNVMIYFDDAVRLSLLNDIERLLKPGGLLFVGHAESLAGILSGFKYVRPSVYRKA